MPIYEYRCADCGAQIEKMQKISDAPLAECESCGGRLEKQISRTGFQFKGSGWYVTDYAGKNQSGASAKNETADASTATAAETKTEKSSAGESTAAGDGASKASADNSGSTKNSGTD